MKNTLRCLSVLITIIILVSCAPINEGHITEEVIDENVLQDAPSSILVLPSVSVSLPDSPDTISGRQRAVAVVYRDNLYVVVESDRQGMRSKIVCENLSTGKVTTIIDFEYCIDSILVYEHYIFATMSDTASYEDYVVFGNLTIDIRTGKFVSSVDIFQQFYEESIGVTDFSISSVKENDLLMVFAYDADVREIRKAFYFDDNEKTLFPLGQSAVACEYVFYSDKNNVYWFNPETKESFLLFSVIKDESDRDVRSYNHVLDYYNGVITVAYRADTVLKYDISQQSYWIEEMVDFQGAYQRTAWENDGYRMEIKGADAKLYDSESGNLVYTIFDYSLTTTSYRLCYFTVIDSTLYYPGNQGGAVIVDLVQ